MTNKEKFMALVSPDETQAVERNRERIRNRAMLRESQRIAIKVLTRLDEKGWSQKDLASILGVTPQQISKIVKGKENLTLETQVKLQEVLDIPILASYYESKQRKVVRNIEMQDSIIEPIEPPIHLSYRNLSLMQSKVSPLSDEITYQQVN